MIQYAAICIQMLVHQPNWHALYNNPKIQPFYAASSKLEQAIDHNCNFKDTKYGRASGCIAEPEAYCQDMQDSHHFVLTFWGSGIKTTYINRFSDYYVQ